MEEARKILSDTPRHFLCRVSKYGSSRAKPPSSYSHQTSIVPLSCGRKNMLTGLELSLVSVSVSLSESESE